MHTDRTTTTKSSGRLYFVALGVGLAGGLASLVLLGSPRTALCFILAGLFVGLVHVFRGRRTLEGNLLPLGITSLLVLAVALGLVLGREGATMYGEDAIVLPTPIAVPSGPGEFPSIVEALPAPAEDAMDGPTPGTGATQTALWSVKQLVVTIKANHDWSSFDVIETMLGVGPGEPEEHLQKQWPATPLNHLTRKLYYRPLDIDEFGRIQRALPDGRQLQPLGDQMTAPILFKLEGVTKPALLRVYGLPEKVSPDPGGEVTINYWKLPHEQLRYGMGFEYVNQGYEFLAPLGVNILTVGSFPAALAVLIEFSMAFGTVNLVTRFLKLARGLWPRLKGLPPTAGVGPQSGY